MLAGTKEASPCLSRPYLCFPLAPFPRPPSGSWLSLPLCRKWPGSSRVTQCSGSVTSSQLHSLRGEVDWLTQVKYPLLVPSATTGGQFTKNKYGSVISHYVLSHFLF